MIRTKNENIFLVFFILLLTSCNSTDTFIVKSTTDTGFQVGTAVVDLLDSVGYIKSIQTFKNETYYTVVVSGKASVRKQATVNLGYTLFDDGHFLQLREKGTGPTISIKDTINLDTALNLSKFLKNLTDSISNLQKIKTAAP